MRLKTSATPAVFIGSRSSGVRFNTSRSYGPMPFHLGHVDALQLSTVARATWLDHAQARWIERLARRPRAWRACVLYWRCHLRPDQLRQAARTPGIAPLVR